jgi:hypothetical protein
MRTGIYLERAIWCGFIGFTYWQFGVALATLVTLIVILFFLEELVRKGGEEKGREGNGSEARHEVAAPHLAANL